MLVYHCVIPFAMSSPLKSTRTCNFRQKTKKKNKKCLESAPALMARKAIKTSVRKPLQGKPAGDTFPRSPLCLDRMLPPFFTATSRVLLWSSTIDTLNSNLQTHTHAHKHKHTLFMFSIKSRWCVVIVWAFSTYPFCPSAFSCRVLVGEVNQCKWDHPAGLPGCI